MTYLKTTLISAAAVALAAPAFAGHHAMDSSQDSEMKDKATMSSDHEMKKMDSSQDGEMKHKATMSSDHEMKTKTSMTEMEAETEVRGATAMHPSKTNDTVGEVLQADGETSIQSDGDVVMADGHTVPADIVRTADEDMIADNAIVVPGSNSTLTTVTCPAGTTAQPDMTCLVTGDYDAELVGKGEMVATD